MNEVEVRTKFSSEDLTLSDLLTTGQYNRFTDPDALYLLAKLKAQGDPEYFNVKRNAENAGWFGKDFEEMVRGWLSKVQQETPAQESEQIPQYLMPRLDDAALYGLAGDIVRALAPETEASDAALLAHVLAFFGNVIGRTARYIVGADEHYGNLYITLVGDSSVGRKGTAASMVRYLFRSVDNVWESNNIATGLSTGEGLIHEVHDDIRKWDVKQQDHVIVEPAIQDKRRCIIESELASMLRQFEKHGSTLSAIIRQAWDGQMLRVMSKITGETATNAHISIIGHITREELSRYLTATEQANGLANRFIWMLVRRDKLLPDGGNIYSLGLEDLISRLQIAIQKARQTTEMQRSDAAGTLWDHVYGKLSEDRYGLVGSLLARAPAQVLRLSCIYALLDGTDTISPDHIKAALAVWQYSEASVKLIFGDKVGSPVADRILSELKTADANGLTRTQINNLLDRNQKAAVINDAIDLLETLGYIRIERESTGGRPVDKIILSGHEINEKTRNKSD